MGLLASLVSSGIGSAVSGVIAPVLGYFTTARNDDLSGFQAGAQADTERFKALLAAQVQMAQIRAAQNTWVGARLIFLALGGLTAYHYGAVILDSVPTRGHVVGSWAIAALPAPMDGWEGTIVLSFFAATLAGPMTSAVTTWLHRK